MEKYRIVVTDDRFGSYLQENEVLQAIDTQVEVHNLTSSSEAITVLADADLLGISSYQSQGSQSG